jgi:DNA-binding MarR family transcriptional regulator
VNLVVAFALGLAAGAVATAAVGYLVVRMGRGRPRPVPTSLVAPTGREEKPAAEADSSRPSGAPPAATLPPSDPPSAPVEVAAEQVRLSERVVLQLGRLGRVDPLAPVPPGRTQQGLTATLASTQSSVSKVLRRLESAEILTAERRHVIGASQRMKIYALTLRGELLARELARRRGVALLPTPRTEPAAATIIPHVPPAAPVAVPAPAPNRLPNGPVPIEELVVAEPRRP